MPDDLVERCFDCIFLFSWTNHYNETHNRLEFLNYNRFQKLSKSLKDILDTIPEGLIIQSKIGDELEIQFVNMKARNTLPMDTNIHAHEIQCHCEKANDLNQLDD